MAARSADGIRIDKELLFLYPYLWKSEVICDFYKKADEKNIGVDIPASSKSRSLKSVSSDWGKVLTDQKCFTKLKGEGKDEIPDKITYNVSNVDDAKCFETTHYDILSWKYGKKRKKFEATKINHSDNDFKNPLELRRFIRNKYEHFYDMPQDFQQALGWTTEDGKLDDNKFAKYWTSLFPSLLPFLWLHFYQASKQKGSSLKPFYPELQANQYNWLDPDKYPIDLDGVLQHLNKALKNDLEKGGVTGRFKIGTKDLEFRTIEENVIFDAKKILKVDISSERMLCSWHDDSFSRQPADTAEFQIGAGQKSRTIIVGNKLCALLSVIITELKIDSIGEIIVFSGRDRMTDFFKEGNVVEEIIERLSKEYDLEAIENPVKWGELGESAQDNLLKNGELGIQNETIKLNSILPTPESRKRILPYLNGTLLTQLLRGMTPVLFQGVKSPTALEIYKNRQFSKLVVLSTKAMETAKRSELFVLSKVSREQIEKFPKERVVVVEKIGSTFEFILTNDTTIFLVDETDICDFELICNALESKGLQNKNIHHFRYMQGTSFEWLNSRGSSSFLESSCANFSSDKTKLEETHFSNTIKSCNESGHTVAVVGPPGNGKTSFFIAQARKSSAECHLTLFLTVTELGAKVSSEKIAEGLSEMMGSTEFEKRLCKHWFQCTNKQKDNQVKFQLFLDALDEVKVEEREKALAILKKIQALSSISICISLRQHMFEDVQKCFQKLALYKLEPFSSKEQVAYIVDYWQRKNNGDHHMSQDSLKRFARDLLKNYLSKDDNMGFADTPLVCYIIAEVYESQALSGEFSISSDHHSISHLFDSMWEKKFEIWCNKYRASNNRHPPTTLDEAHDWYTYLAMKLLFSEQIAKNFERLLIPKKSGLARMKSFVLEQGIVTSLNPVTFIHQLFAEDAIARFIAVFFTGEFPGMDIDNPDFEYLLSHHVLGIDVKANYDNNGILCLSLELRYPNLWQMLNARSGTAGMSLSREICYLFTSIEWGLYKYHSHEIDCSYAFTIALNSRYNNLVVMLFKSPKYLFAIFIKALRRRHIDFCDFILQEHACMIFDPESWTRYASSDRQNIYSKEHWFLQMVSDISAHPNCLLDGSRFFSPDPKLSISIEEVMSRVKLKKGFSVEQKDSEGKTPLLSILSMPVSQGPSRLAYHLVADLQADVNAVDHFGNTVFHVCKKYEAFDCLCEWISQVDVAQSYIQLWQLFLDKGCTRDKINTVNSMGETPLFAAVRVFGKKAVHTLQFFKENGANLNWKDERGETALDKAINSKYGELVEGLIDAGAEFVGMQTFSDYITFLITTRCWETRIDRYDQKCGHDFHTLNSKGETLAHLIIENCTTKLVEKLFQSVDVLSVKNGKGDSALHFAAIKNAELLAVCIEKFGLDIHGKDKSFLHKVMGREKSELIRKLYKEYDANFNTRNSQGESLLEKAISLGDGSVVDALVECGADISQLGENEECVFSLASMGSSVAFEKYIDQFGIDFNISNKHGESLASVIFRKCSINLIERMILGGVKRSIADAQAECALPLTASKSVKTLCPKKFALEVSKKDARGKTIFHRFLEQTEDEVFIRRLVDLGVDINAVGNSGESALHLAALENPELLKMFVEKFGADINAVNKSGESVLHVALLENPSLLLRFVLEFGVDVNQIGPCGNSAFHHVVQSRFEPEPLVMVKYFISSNKANISVKNSNGQCALDLARHAGNGRIARLLMEKSTDHRGSEARTVDDFYDNRLNF